MDSTVQCMYLHQDSTIELLVNPVCTNRASISIQVDHFSASSRKLDILNMIPNLGLDTVEPDTQVLHSSQVYTRDTFLISHAGLDQGPGQRDMETGRVVHALAAGSMCDRTVMRRSI